MGVRKGVGEVVVGGGAAFVAVAFELGVEPLLFLVGEPGGVVGVIAQQEQDGDAEEDGRDAFHEEEPLPAVEVEATFKLEQDARQLRRRRRRRWRWRS